ncbi:MAG: hypothetical protein ACR2P3_06505 [Geminicoccaceae bacterium]
MKRISLVLASALLLTSTGGAFATDSGGIKIAGHVENDVYAEYNDNYAFGTNATAKQAIGSFVGDVDISGTVYNWVTAYDNENMADGNGAEACQYIGSFVGQECAD